MLSFSSIFLILIIKVCLATDNCDNNAVLFYEDIDCKPIRSDEATCPNRYDCKFSQTKSGCTFKGKTYQIGEGIDSNLTYSACSIGCTCTELNKFTCAVLDCPEFFGAPFEIHQNCHHGYTLGKCCSTGQVCNSTKTCEFEGGTYKIGQRFYPNNTCLNCVCHEEFTGAINEKTCIKHNCNTQIHYLEEILKNCAPAYFETQPGKVICCPDDFVCPKADDDIKVVNSTSTGQAKVGFECAYGDRKLKQGEGFNRRVNKYGADRNLQCECLIPPLVTCKEIIS
ncbi:unnamed protein product [Ceutorhynchus assimilis]|uniref:VWFC domain-containing protein n=1 Tax=Ceutorhynchus assimilis TaxID=467358 RepID=A0A9N9MLS1_9CUCU|nr:unnamed protein product [Ceutorhynchus assimilis]